MNLKTNRDFAIGVCIAIIGAGLVDTFLYSLLPAGGNRWLYLIINVLTPESHPGYLNLSPGFIRWVGLVFPLLGIIGVIQYYSSGKKSTSLLQFMLCYLVTRIALGWIFTFLSLFMVLYRGYSILGMYGLEESLGYMDADELRFLKQQIAVSLIGGLITSIVWVWAYLTAYRAFQHQRAVRIAYHEGDTPQPYLVSAETGHRFGHYLLDSLFLTYLALAILSVYGRVVFPYLDIIGSSEDDSGVRLLLLAGIYIVLIFYYIISETLFRKSPAKVLTNCIVANNEGERAGFGKIAARTFSRLIPFERFSFLFGSRGWHDSISDTYVLRDDYKEEEKIDFEFLKTDEAGA